MSRQRTLLLAAPVALLALLTACGDDDGGSSDTTAAPEASYEIVSDATVAQGYASMLTEMAKLSADPSTATAAALDEVHEMWEGFEGTVKQNDSEAYLASEEALDAFLEAGAKKELAAMAAATQKMTLASAAYLAKHPG